MPSDEKYLKSEYSWKIYLFIAAHIAIFLGLLISNSIAHLEIRPFWDKFLEKDGMYALLAPIITIILTGIFPPGIKASLVFWKIKYPLPGCRVFTILGPKDDRINMSKLQQKYGNLPIEPKEQNTLWYKIYKSQSSKASIINSHADFLFTRDLTAISVILLIILLPITYFISMISSEIRIIYTSILILQYIILAIVSQNYGNRFVCNVLAEESSVWYH